MIGESWWELLRSIVTMSFDSKTFGRFDDLTLYVRDNKITQLPAALCDADNKSWNQRDVTFFGCDGLMCPPGTASSSALSLLPALVCRPTKSPRLQTTGRGDQTTNSHHISGFFKADIAAPCRDSGSTGRSTASAAQMDFHRAMFNPRAGPARRSWRSSRRPPRPFTVTARSQLAEPKPRCESRRGRAPAGSGPRWSASSEWLAHRGSNRRCLPANQNRGREAGA